MMLRGGVPALLHRQSCLAGMEGRSARVTAHVTRTSLDMIRELGEARGFVASKHALGVDTDSLGLHALLVSDAAGAL